MWRRAGRGNSNPKLGMRRGIGAARGCRFGIRAGMRTPPLCDVVLALNVRWQNKNRGCIWICVATPSRAD